MPAASILNHVLGPVTPGPSSSHTAGPWRLARLARDLLGGSPQSAAFLFDPAGSLAEVYQAQGSDKGFVAGLLGLDLEDPAFLRALDLAATRGIGISFLKKPIPESSHPNAVVIRLAGAAGQEVEVLGESVGGGAVQIKTVDGWPTVMAGEAFETLLWCRIEAAESLSGSLARKGDLAEVPRQTEKNGEVLVQIRRSRAWAPGFLEELGHTEGIFKIRAAGPVLYPHQGRPLFASAGEMVAWAKRENVSLGRAALAYETSLLGLEPEEILAEIRRRYRVVAESVRQGLSPSQPATRLLHPSAGPMMRAEAEGRLFTGGIWARAAARALAVTHQNAVSGLVVAAPTAGSAAVLSAVLVTLAEDKGLDLDKICLSLLAAGGAGLALALRGSFAAEEAGCQVETGAGLSMAAAAVVEAAGGTARQAAAAAAVAFHNSMGLVCDPVQGLVEIPCHTRNAQAAGSAFVLADLILGGYVNPIPLDETVDAVMAVGRMLPRELRCTALGGLSICPSGRAIRAGEGG